MNKSIKRVISTILAATFAVCAPLLGASTNAESIEDAVGLTAVDTTSESISSVFSEKDIPECLALEISENSKFAARLYEKETSLDTVLFANKDGSETVYIFNEDVKYIDESGNIADKSNKLYSNIESRVYSTDYSYVNKENDINTYFPKSLKTDVGVSVEAQGQVIEMYPVSDVVSQVIADNDMYGVYYDDVFGEFTGIRYEPSFSGYKEDIVLEKNVGNKFSFILETGDLVPVLENGVIYIRDGSGADFGLISPTYVYDSFTGDPSLDESRHFTYNNKFELARISDGKYELIVIVDEEFLSNPATVYPVIVDPSITINATGSGSSKSILDTPIYNGSGAAGTAGVNSLAVIGYVDSSYGSGRLLMRFPGLMSKAFMTNPNYIIKSANLHMNEVSGRSASATISAYLYMGNSSWSESSTFSNSLWSGAYGAVLSSYNFTYPSATTGNFNITQAVRLWQSNPQYREKGLIFKNATNESSATYAKSFYTTEGDTKPYLSVTYENRTRYDTAFWTTGVPSKSLTIKLNGTTANNSTWRPLIVESCNAWNSSYARTSISVNGASGFSSSTTLEVGYYEKDESGRSINWYGRTSPSVDGSGNRCFNIQINTKTLGSKSSTVKKSTITHEIGHLLWLYDFEYPKNPVPGGEYSLMDHGRDREIVYIPQAMDVYHVNSKF